MLTLLVSAILSPLRWYEHLRFAKAIEGLEIKDDPVFIVGHWRSGTTYLHNILCQDPQFSYISTFHATFPEYLLGRKTLLLPLFKIVLPETRPGDNVRLSADSPQEDEFALGCTTPYSFYHYLFFPERLDTYYQKSVSFESEVGSFKEEWQRKYLLIIKKAVLDRGGGRFVSKNPAHTGRVKTLIEMFPKAKFIHIYRNPVTVFLSTLTYLDRTMAKVQLSAFDHRELEAQVLMVHRRILDDFFREKERIPDANYIEVRYEEFEKEPLSILEEIYARFDIPDYEKAKPRFAEYAEGQRKHQKNKHYVGRQRLTELARELQPTMERWGYGVPSDVEVREYSE